MPETSAIAAAYVLYNENAGDGNTLESVHKLKDMIDEEPKFINVCDISDYKKFFLELGKNDYIIVAGGDGTLNRFINDTDGIEYGNNVLYYPNGTGNDFAHDMGYERECKPFDITDKIKNLPYVTVNGKTSRFINGVGYGIDGYCCEIGDNLKKIPGKKINYTSIAIKGLLFHYKPVNAKVTVDGITREYKNVWIAPTMHGRFYGGGMMPTPDQDRDSGKLSVMIFYRTGKLHTLMLFPTLFKGEHVKYTKRVAIIKGKEVTVEFDRPTALQIDGETVLGVSSYTARTVVTAAADLETAEIK